MSIEFSEADRRALRHERFHHPHPRVQQKMEVLWLYSHGLSPKKLCQLAAICRTTFYNYLKDYQEGGLEKLKEVNFNRPKSQLEEYRSTLEAYFRAHPPASIKEAIAKIEELTGLKRSKTQVRKFLKSMGMSYRKIGMLPAKADEDEQEAFKTDQLDPVLEQAKEGKRKVFFVDAAHFVLAPFLGFLWSFSRLFIRAPAGRRRFNVLGALDALTHELFSVTNDSYINAESVCELLLQLRHHYVDLPITLILDNAKYQKCHLVWEMARLLDIDLLYLPSYSPNLNLIERLWKFVKKKCLYAKYYSDFSEFKSAISACLSHTHDTYKEELDSLLRLNFQSFKKVDKLAFV